MTSSHVLTSLYQHLGIDPALTIPDNNGRPMYLLDERESRCRGWCSRTLWLRRVYNPLVQGAIQENRHMSIMPSVTRECRFGVCCGRFATS